MADSLHSSNATGNQASAEQTSEHETHAVMPSLADKMRRLLDALLALEGEEIEYRDCMTLAAATKVAREWLRYNEA